MMTFKGTSIISLAGILGALKIRRGHLTDKNVCFGAGTAGGIANPCNV